MHLDCSEQFAGDQTHPGGKFPACVSDRSSACSLIGISRFNEFSLMKKSGKGIFIRQVFYIFRVGLLVCFSFCSCYSRVKCLLKNRPFLISHVDAATTAASGSPVLMYSLRISSLIAFCNSISLRLASFVMPGIVAIRLISQEPSSSYCWRI